MLTVEEAVAKIVRETTLFERQTIPLAESLGLVLAEDVVSDTDSPPFDKALMDGFAVRSADVADGKATLKLIEEVTAGEVPDRPVGPGEATQIMTGAPMPVGADAVARVEDTRILDSGGGLHAVEISTVPIRPGANMMQRGTAFKKGQQVLGAGRQLRPQELGALAEMGKHQVLAWRRPRIGVLATGDELVPISQRPGPGQIRNSNETMLAAQIQRAGAEPVRLGIARDEPDHLREKILSGLDCDLLLLSGGVSAGKLDLVPSQLEAAGVRPVFHKVRVKPGKPIWFGVFDPDCGEPPSGTAARTASNGAEERTSGSSDQPDRQGDSAEDRKSASTRCYVFGLPGNPVSSMVCFELFVRTAIRRLVGIEPPEPSAVRARLTKEHVARGDRPSHFPARLDWADSRLVVTPVTWHGSADLQSTVQANATILFPPGERTYRPDEIVDVYRWD